jgi:hypothetical protein
MAFPTVSAPYGLKPVNLIGGQVFAGATRQMRIASGYNTSIFYGDIVSRISDGTIAKEAGTTSVAATGVVGVFLGCSYINTATNQPTFSQYFPANTAVTSGFITAFVADDPDQLFQVAVVSSTTVIAGLQYTDIGLNSALVQNAGVTTSGNSQVAILQAAATTSTLPMRIVDVVPDTSYVTSGTTYFAEAIVKFNAPVIVSSVVTGGHSYNNSVGL